MTGDRVMVLRENTFELNGVPQRFGLARTLNGKSEMNGAAFWVSLDPVFMTPDGELQAHLPAWMQQAIKQGAYDAVVTPATKCVVAAGDAVGYLSEDIAPDGEQRVEKSAFVHIELLSTDSRMRDFLNNTAGVKSGQKYLHIHPESYLYQRTGDTFTRTDGQVKKDIHQILPQDKCHPFTDSSGKRWFDIGESAWLSEEDVDADIAQYDLMKLGFSAFEEPPTSDMTQSLHEGWIKSAFTQLAEWVRPERGIQEKQVSTWYKAILRKMDSDNSGDLSGAELYHALHFLEKDVRDIAAKMVVKHDSEWFGGSQHHRWKTFLQRTDRLYVSYVRQWFDDMEWMSQVPEFSSGEPVWHMHPVVFLDALKVNINTKKLVGKEFVKFVFDEAKKNEIDSHVPAAITTAQAILETGYGKSVPIDIYSKEYSNNLFGIKAHGNSGYVWVHTHEFINGVKTAVVDKFMKYSSYEESIAGRSAFFVKNKRYHFLFDYDDPCDWARGLQQAGYATDPNYANKLISIMKKESLL